MKSIILISVLAILTGFHSVTGQVHYVPAQILIPTLNASHFNAIYYNNTSFHKNNNTFNNYSTDGNLILGNIGYLDRLLFNQVYIKPRRWWTTRVSNIEYPKDVPGGYVRHETIAAIRVYNQFYDGPGAKATIITGGVGKPYVRIQLKSKWGRGFKFLVQIYGH